jgi:hypothetical protein
MNIEELIAANAPNVGGRSNGLSLLHSTMSGVEVWMSHNSNGLSTVFIDGNSTTTRLRLTADELEQLGAMLIAQARWMRQQP